LRRASKDNGIAAVIIHVRLLNLSSTNFRNLKTGSVEFSPCVNVFIGNNGQGKTNLLEAAHFFKFGRSFRKSRDVDMVRFGEAFCRVSVECIYDSGIEESFSFAVDETGEKIIKMHGIEVPKLSELVGRYPCVLFGPQDLNIVNGFPAERRRFVDMTGSMGSVAYLGLLRDYNRVLAQRNAMLKTGASRAEMRAWDDELVARGANLIRERRTSVNALKHGIRGYIESFSEEGEFGIEYESSLGDEDIEETFYKKLGEVEAEERGRGTTLVGPHRDDIAFTIDNQDLKRYGSQGQKRLFAIMIRLAEMNYIESALEESCVLLLDDVFSELDGEAAGRLMQALQGPEQVFVTSPASIIWEGKDETRVFDVSAGELARQP
jgi:DNA replication and repair protein RecF